MLVVEVKLVGGGFDVEGGGLGRGRFHSTQVRIWSTRVRIWSGFSQPFYPTRVRLLPSTASPLTFTLNHYNVLNRTDTVHVFG